MKQSTLNTPTQSFEGNMGWQFLYCIHGSLDVRRNLNA